jgi:peptidoglycan hydrolase-like protein with peptidoglycan-binding domain
LATVYDRIPEIAVDGIFGPQTRDAVYALQDLFDLTVDGSVDSLTWAKIADEYNTIVAGKERADDQFPGYTVS